MGWILRPTSECLPVPYLIPGCNTAERRTRWSWSPSVGWVGAAPSIFLPGLCLSGCSSFCGVIGPVRSWPPSLWECPHPYFSPWIASFSTFLVKSHQVWHLGVSLDQDLDLDHRPSSLFIGDHVLKYNLKWIQSSLYRLLCWCPMTWNNWKHPGISQAERTRILLSSFSSLEVCVLCPVVRCLPCGVLSHLISDLKVDELC